MAAATLLAALAAFLLISGCSGGELPTQAVAGPTVAAASSAPAATSALAPTSTPGPELSSAAPFELPSAAGKPVALSSYLGEKNVVLVFYRTYQ